MTDFVIESLRIFFEFFRRSAINIEKDSQLSAKIKEPAMAICLIEKTKKVPPGPLKMIQEIQRSKTIHFA